MMGVALLDFIDPWDYLIRALPPMLVPPHSVGDDVGVQSRGQRGGISIVGGVERIPFRKDSSIFCDPSM